MAQYLGEKRRRRPLGLLRVFIEIPVIALSILLAFLLDNWGEDTKQKELEQKYLIELLAEANINKEELDEDQNTRKQQVELLNKIIETGIRTVDADTLRMAVKELLIHRFYSPTDAVYQDLTSSGKLSIISNDNIRHQLFEYRRYMSKAPIAEASDRQLIEAHIEPYLVNRQVLSLLEPYENIDAINISDVQINRIIRQLLNDRAFIDLTYLRINRIQTTIYFANPVQWHLRDMIKLIETELKAFQND